MIYENMWNDAVPSEQDIIAYAEDWFVSNWQQFVSKPDSFRMYIKEDYLMVEAKWKDGVTDIGGFGNIYKWAWNQSILMR